MWDCPGCGCKNVAHGLSLCPMCGTENPMPKVTSGGASNAWEEKEKGKSAEAGPGAGDTASEAGTASPPSRSRPSTRKPKGGDGAKSEDA